jgi:hypothetical protein
MDSALSLRDVNGDEKGPIACGYNWRSVSLGDLNEEIWSSVLGVEREADKLTLQNNYCCSCKYLKTAWANSRQTWQNLLRKGMAQKKLFCQ